MPAPEALGDFTASRRVPLLIAMAAMAGTVSALVAILLMRMIGLITNLAYYGRFSLAFVSPAANRLGLAAVVVPVIGSFVVGLMARFGSDKIRGHGIPEAIEAILISDSRLEPKVAVLKPIASAIAIGTGGPFGAEGPIIMTGGAFGSIFAQIFHLSAAERKTLLVAGAAAGMAATFNTPIAAVLIAVELLLFEWKPRSFLPVATAAAVATAIRPLLIGGGPIFPVTEATLLPDWGLLLCAGLGVTSGLAAAALTTFVYGAEDLFCKLPIHWMWWPMLGGLVVGLGGLIAPHALGVGYDVIALLLKGQFPFRETLILLVVKATIWTIALSSGTSGGVLAPLLIMGGALGAIAGHVLPVGTVGFWALIGMAATMTGALRTPLTGVIFALEATHDVTALLPLLVACSAAYALTVLLLKRSILTEKVARRGHHLICEYGTDPFETLRAERIMVRTVESLAGDMRVAEALAFFAAEQGRSQLKRYKSYPVTDASERVIGMVSASDARRAAAAPEPAGDCLADLVAGQRLVFAHPDEPIRKLVERMVEADVAAVPILDRGTGGAVGIVSRRELLGAHAVVRAAEHNRSVSLRLWWKRPGTIAPEASGP